MARIVHFEIHVDDPARAIAFYTEVFGWNIEKWDNSMMDYWMIMTGDENSQMKGREGQGIDGGMLRRQGKAPQGGEPVTSYVCMAEVDDLDTYSDRVLKAGGTVAVEKMAVPEIGWLTYFKDTEGNIFGLMQPDSKAK